MNEFRNAFGIEKFDTLKIDIAVKQISQLDKSNGNKTLFASSGCTERPQFAIVATITTNKS